MSDQGRWLVVSVDERMVPAREGEQAFDTRDEAVAYAEKHEIPYQVFEPHTLKPRPKSYSDNFRFDRKIPWSH